MNLPRTLGRVLTRLAGLSDGSDERATSRHGPRHAANVTVDVYDTDLLTYLWPEWPALNKREKLTLLRGGELSPVDTAENRNVSCIELHQLFASSIDPEQDVNDFVSKLNVGVNYSGGTSVNDVRLNNKVGDTPITDTVYTPADAELQVTTFIDATEFNGNTLDEIGVETEGGRFCNHSQLSPAVDKTNAKTVVVDVFFTVQNA